MAYSRVAHHAGMIFDANRNDAYALAIGKLVHPASVVLDLGAGLGIHGLLAAAHGAARVYLVEPQPVVNAAMEAARASGLGDKVFVLQDRIEDIRVPEPVDLIVSVLTGNLLFTEDLLPSLFHARDHYLKPGGALLPDRAQLWLAPLHAPGLHASHVGRWADKIMGLDYAPLRRFAANDILWLRREDFAGASRLSPGVVMADLDLVTASSTDCDARATCLVENAGVCHGLMGWIRIRLLDQWLSTEPEAAEMHWSPVMLPVDPPLLLEAGEHTEITLQRPTGGHWTWSLAARAGTRRHSTFLADISGSRELARVAPASSPGLNEEGQTLLQILSLLRDGLSNQAVAQQIEPSQAHGSSGALRKVQAVAMRYGGRS